MRSIKLLDIAYLTTRGTKLGSEKQFVRAPIYTQVVERVEEVAIEYLYQNTQFCTYRVPIDHSSTCKLYQK